MMPGTMQWTLIETFLRQRLGSPMRILITLFFFSFPLLFAVFTSNLNVVQNAAGPFALILAAGAIGQDVASGVLQLVFARPVARAEYVLARWLACVLGASTLCALQLILEFLKSVYDVFRARRQSRSSIRRAHLQTT